MATQTAAAAAAAPNISFNMIRTLAWPWLLRTIAAIACVLVMYVASHSHAVPAAAVAVTGNTPGSSISPHIAEPDYTQDYVPEKQSDGEFAQIKVGRLALYYEMVMLFIALGIGIGALARRVQMREDKPSTHLEPKTNR